MRIRIDVGQVEGRQRERVEILDRRTRRRSAHPAVGTAQHQAGRVLPGAALGNAAQDLRERVLALADHRAIDRLVRDRLVGVGARVRSAGEDQRPGADRARRTRQAVHAAKLRGERREADHVRRKFRERRAQRRLVVVLEVGVEAAHVPAEIARDRAEHHRPLGGARGLALVVLDPRLHEQETRGPRRSERRVSKERHAATLSEVPAGGEVLSAAPGTGAPAEDAAAGCPNPRAAAGTPWGAGRRVEASPGLG